MRDKLKTEPPSLSKVGTRERHLYTHRGRERAQNENNYSANPGIIRKGKEKTATKGEKREEGF